MLLRLRRLEKVFLELVVLSRAKCGVAFSSSLLDPGLNNLPWYTRSWKSRLATMWPPSTFLAAVGVQFVGW